MKLPRSRTALIALCLAVSACGTTDVMPSALDGLPVTGSIAPPALTPIANVQTTPECAAIEASINNSVQYMANDLAKARTEQAAPPANLAQAFQRMTGPPGSGVPALDDYRTERARADGLNGSLAAKGCIPVRIDERLAQTPPEPGKKPGETPARPEFGKTQEASSRL